MGVLAKIVMKLVGDLEGVCAKCGSSNIGFTEEDGVVFFRCIDCGSDEIRDISFSHFKKLFRVEYVKGMSVVRDWGKKNGD